MTYPGVPAGKGPDDAASAVDGEAGSLASIPPSGHANDETGPGVNYGRPSRYDGPAVAEQAPMVNPSAGDIGPPGGGVNPMGASPQPGSVPTGSSATPSQAPQDTSKGNPNHNGS